MLNRSIAGVINALGNLDFIIEAIPTLVVLLLLHGLFTTLLKDDRKARHQELESRADPGIKPTR